jgi:16S rRNA (cytidine1402-2'-O)-methyltransferase
VRDAIEAGIEFTMIPGASAVIMAVVLSGLPMHSFTFRGFPPRKGGPRRRFLAVDRESPHTLVFYESPYRIVKFLQDALEVYGDRPAVVANELTKLFETMQRGTISELIAFFSENEPRGEYVIVIAGKDAPVNAANSEDDDA